MYTGSSSISKPLPVCRDPCLASKQAQAALPNPYHSAEIPALHVNRLKQHYQTLSSLPGSHLACTQAQAAFQNPYQSAEFPVLQEHRLKQHCAAGGKWRIGDGREGVHHQIKNAVDKGCAIHGHLRAQLGGLFKSDHKILCPLDSSTRLFKSD